MSAQRWTWGLALALVAQAALADNAKPRGGSSGSSSSSGGSRHPSGSSASASSGSSRSGSSSSTSQSSGASNSDRRHPRPGTGSAYGYRHYYPYGYGHGYGYYYSPYYYPYSDYYGYWGAPYYSGYGYYRYGYRSSDAGAVRVQVDPDEARVYVDGYYAGIVDDFDGIFQRLYVAPGRHELTLKLEGYRTHRVKLYVPYGHTVKFHYDMVKGSGEDSSEDLAGPIDQDRDGDRGYSHGRDGRQDDRDGADDDDSADDPDEDRPRAEDRDSRRAAGAGALHLSVRPDDASVYVDGQFRGSGRQVRDLEVPAGRHHIEVVRPGFKTFERQVEVKAGEAVEIDAELERP